MSPGQRPVIAREMFRDIHDIRRITSSEAVTSVPCPECGRTLSNGEWLSLGVVRKNDICTWPGARGFPRESGVQARFRRQVDCDAFGVQIR